ncbi:MAG: hypothetical protein NWE93_14240 [Candidatus Bathyarchaeota archaeon]|nr:hypothetical protein [Candidatus Bathyarchaeota archaeon]
MKRTPVSLLIAVFTLLIILPLALPNSMVAAQTSNTVTSVESKIQVMYSGQVVILDTIHLAEPAQDGFMIGLPYQYSAYLLKGLAYDDTHVYQINLGMKLGNRSSGFYGAEINFNGEHPTQFTVAFILSNRLVTELDNGAFVLEYPAYPSLTLDAQVCSVSLSFPGNPTALSISKDDGSVHDAAYTANNLPAYTYSVAKATFTLPAATLQLCTITGLDRQITIDTNGALSATDTYEIISNSTSPLTSFVLCLPQHSTNIGITDQYGADLKSSFSPSTDSDVLLANITFVSSLTSDQTTQLKAQYSLPSTQLVGSNYMLEFKLFPSFHYFVDHATMTFNTPEGATIVSPQPQSLDISSSLTRSAYQDTLTVTESGISYVDYLAPQPNSLDLSYNYNPVWVSFRPTFYAASAAAFACLGAVVYRVARPKKEPYRIRAEELSTQMPTPQQEASVYEIKTGQQITADNIRSFVDAYDDRTQLYGELRTLEARAQKGKIPRRQYKVQKNAVEVRVEGLTRSLERAKALFRGSGGTYPDLIRQLDLAESDLSLADQNIRTLEQRYSKGEISLESYKKSIGDYQKMREKAQSAINGILMRLREKIR